MHSGFFHRLVVTLGLSLLLITQAWSQGSSPSKRAPTKSAPAEQVNNAITQAALQQKMTACAPRIEQITNFMGFGPNAGAMFFNLPGEPNQRLIPLSLELATPGTQPSYASVSLMPSGNQHCMATYELTTWWPVACSQINQTQFANTQPAGVLYQSFAVLQINPSARVFLMPAGPNGCISIKREVIGP